MSLPRRILATALSAGMLWSLAAPVFAASRSQDSSPSRVEAAASATTEDGTVANAARCLIVGVDPKRMARTRVAAFALAAGSQVVTRAASFQFIVVRVPLGKDLAKIAAALRGASGVRYVEPDRVRHTDMTPSDPAYRRQWGLAAVQASSAWDVTTGASNVVVAVVDSGVDYTPPDLVGQVLSGEGYDLVNDDADAMDDNGHGTHVAGIVAAAMDNGLYGTGLAPGCRILPVKVMDSRGSGDDATIARGIDYAVDHGAKVINMSLGGPGVSTVLLDATSYARRHDVTLVASAGNYGAYARAIYPAADPGVVAVAATQSNGHAAAFSSWGPYVDLAAPGVDIYSTVPGRGFVAMSGTSMAAPFVSAAAALVRSHFGDSSGDAVARLESSATDLGARKRDDHFGFGLIDVAAALGRVKTVYGTSLPVRDGRWAAAVRRYAASLHCWAGYKISSRGKVAFLAMASNGKATAMVARAAAWGIRLRSAYKAYAVSDLPTVLHRM